MASTAKLDAKTLEELSGGPAGSVEYLKQKKWALERFQTHVAKVEQRDFNSVMKSDEELDHCLKS